jgi:hypothetical protein
MHQDENSRSCEMLEAANARQDYDAVRALLWCVMTILVKKAPGMIRNGSETEWLSMADECLKQLCTQVETAEFIRGPMTVAAKAVSADLSDLHNGTLKP